MDKTKNIHCKILKKKSRFQNFEMLSLSLHKTETYRICEECHSFQKLNHGFQDILNSLNIKINANMIPLFTIK